ncbi:hypothetical protein Kpho01_47670 [Kitasatospora phosalacinea]|uniref:Uncharacterized protein n=1 Tax=Kitasatospora phosalacinea TaxID=2065 RepID=A0A9W6UNS1_9ACTN|nr:hypothetical protein Kpho01_47670 [Kitasatospora phosalacinea]
MGARWNRFGRSFAGRWWGAVLAVVLVPACTGSGGGGPGGTDGGPDAKAVGRVVLVVTGAGAADGSPAERSGGVRAGADGRNLEQVASGGSALFGVAASAGLAVAVGVDPSGHGTVLRSADGRRWQEPVTVADPLVDVAHGPDGTWLAVGRARDAEDSAGTVVVYRSTDGTTWEPVSRHGADGGRYGHRPLAVAYGGGRWLMLVHDCAGASLCGVHLLSSIDRGASWTRMPDEEQPEGRDGSVPNALLGLGRTAGLAHDGHRFAVVGGRDPRPGSTAAPSAVAATSADGIVWERPAAPVRDTVPTGLTWDGVAWLAVDGPSSGPAGAAEGAPAPSGGDAGRGVWTSTDLQGWSRLATLDAPVRDIAVLDPGRTAAPAAPAPAGSLRLRPQALEVMADERTVKDAFRYDASPTGAIAALTALYGAPAAPAFRAGDGICVPDRTELRWDGITLTVPGRDPAAAGSFDVRQETVGATEQDPARLRTVQGIALGSTREQVTALAPGSPAVGSEDGELVLTESPDGEAGVLVHLAGRRVTLISAPGPLVDVC